MEHALTPLNTFLANPSLTPSSYDYTGIPAGERFPCQVGKTVYCIVAAVDPGPQIYYNKTMFKAAGISAPPSSWSQVVHDAKLTTNPQHAGICMQGSEASPNGYPVLEMIPYFLLAVPGAKSGYLGANWVPLWNTPGATALANDYAQLMQNYAPAEVSAFDDNDCVEAYQTGKVAMLWDNALDAKRLYSPKLNPQTGNVTGVAELPCPTSNESCVFSVPFAFFINNNSTTAQKVASWKFIEFVTSPAEQLKQSLLQRTPTWVRGRRAWTTP